MIDKARQEFGKHVARLRRGQRLTREQLAILADLKPVTVKNMELGRFNVPFDVMNRVAVVLGGEIKIVLNDTYVIEMSEIKEAITWLEKQGEQKLEEKPLISLKDFQDAFELKAKQYNIELPNRGYDIHAMCKELYSLLIQQKQEWSEEQIKVLDKVIRNPHLSTDEYNGLIALKEQLKTQKGESV